MRTVLWLGAHKTGTTYLQKSLDLSRDELRSEGVFYMELEEFRTRYSRVLFGSRGCAAPPDAFHHPGTKLNLIFDENIAEYVQHVLGPGRFYPRVTERADRILHYLNLDPDEIVLGIRSYDEYLPSLYCETLRSTPYRTFDEFLIRSFGSAGDRVGAAPSVDEFTNLDWVPMVGRLAGHYPTARIRVYFYERVRSNEAALLSAITTVAPDRIQLLGLEERPGFSGPAIDLLERIHATRSVTFADVQRAVGEYPRAAGLPAFDPFGDTERAILRERYRNDSQRIRDSRRIETIDLS